MYMYLELNIETDSLRNNEKLFFEFRYGNRRNMESNFALQRGGNHLGTHNYKQLMPKCPSLIPASGVNV